MVVYIYYIYVQHIPDHGNAQHITEAQKGTRLYKTLDTQFPNGMNHTIGTNPYMFSSNVTMAFRITKNM